MYIYESNKALINFERAINYCSKAHGICNDLSKASLTSVLPPQEALEKPFVVFMFLLKSCLLLQCSFRKVIKHYLHTAKRFKGTVQRDFLTPVFFTKRLILVSIDMP